ncbi:hypothetical protein I551_1128 [Mycobacterium ulcerans str. Harvey]|uniref:Uncharacterized protein n=1 Tax=Mycobacterium ulcerans str. Harvey TaxID=1299332 RepID=A0ABP3AQE6_MYCUL|nr:hypothetical protein I551_1128 [Mycobacterium ulcerans str. Harvey]
MMIFLATAQGDGSDVLWVGVELVLGLALGSGWPRPWRSRGGQRS